MNTGIISSVLGLAFISLIIFILMIGFRILMSFAIYYDIKANNIKSVTPWIVATVFFPVATYIIYIIVKKDQEKTVPKMCLSCNSTLDRLTSICPICGGVQFIDYVMPNNAKQKRIAKKLYISSLVVFIVLAILIGARAVMSSNTLDKISNDSDFNDFIEEFDKNYDEDFYLDNPLEDFGE